MTQVSHYNTAVVVLDTVTARSPEDALKRLQDALAAAGFTATMAPDARVWLGTYEVGTDAGDEAAAA